LPESQLDRFLMRIGLGYPSPQLERQLLLGRDRRELLAELEPTLPHARLQSLQGDVPRVHASEALLDYVQAVARFTRECHEFENGLSPRATISLLRAAQAWALSHNHAGVLPEDVQAVLPAVVGHRLAPRDDARFRDGREVGRFVLEPAPVP
jgi:MoxR-like ATPase